ncbi:MAG: hypothetical protein VZS44_02015 [Bacilli bacterium]|nr:hypothetical protein [Bacilli bacterium]
MICNKCGNPINEGEMVCSKCGEPVAQTPTPTEGVAPVAQPNVPIPGVVSSAPANPAPQAPVEPTPAMPSETPATVAATPEASMGASIPSTDPNALNNNPAPTADLNNPQPINPQQLNQQSIDPQQLNSQPVAPEPTPEPEPPEKKKGGKGGLIFIIILLLAIIGGLVFYILKGEELLGKKKNTTPTETTETPDTETTETTETTEAEPVANTKTATINGLTLTIPEGLEFSTTTADNGIEMIEITDSAKTMAAVFGVFNEDVKDYLTPEKITAYATEGGLTNGTASVTNYNDYNYAIYHGTADGKTANAFIGKIEDKGVIGVVLEGTNYNAETSFGYISTIAKSASGTASSTFGGKSIKPKTTDNFLDALK